MKISRVRYMMGIAALVSGLAVGACSVFGIRSGTEEPAYRSLAQIGRVEIREYGPRLAAETAVDGDEEAARSAGFRRIAAFIFGANRAQAKIAMTAPVGQAPASGEAAKIAMTAPVGQARDAAGRWVVRFYMPASYTLDTLPTPTDPQVHIVSLPAETLAVLRFSGLPSTASVAAEQASLLAALQGGPWVAQGAPFAWFYDPPWTLPPLRRNEVAVAVVGRS